MKIWRYEDEQPKIEMKIETRIETKIEKKKMNS